jgi:pimeloyl-ACP methyl ester carboxylesterase
LSGNTTGNLIADIELLQVHLDVERWLVLGGSWGSAVALAYAERFPTRVTELASTGWRCGSRARAKTPKPARQTRCRGGWRDRDV